MTAAAMTRPSTRKAEAQSPWSIRDGHVRVFGESGAVDISLMNSLGGQSVRELEARLTEQITESCRAAEQAFLRTNDDLRLYKSHKAQHEAAVKEVGDFEVKLSKARAAIAEALEAGRDPSEHEDAHAGIEVSLSRRRQRAETLATVVARHLAAAKAAFAEEMATHRVAEISRAVQQHAAARQKFEAQAGALLDDLIESQFLVNMLRARQPSTRLPEM